MKRCFIATLALAGLACATTSTSTPPEDPAAPAPDAALVDQEKRLARLMRESELGLLAVRRAEMEALLFELSGLAGPPRTRAEGERVQKRMAEVLKKHDPQMAAVMAEVYAHFGCRAVQSLAKTQLKSLYVAEESYRAEHDVYTDRLAQLGLPARGDYELRVRLSEGGYRATATNHEKAPDDAWSMNQSGELVHDVDGCPAPAHLQPTEDERQMLRAWYLKSARQALEGGLDLARAKAREDVAARLAGVDGAAGTEEDRARVDAQHGKLMGRLKPGELARFAKLHQKSRCVIARGDGPRRELRALYVAVEAFRAEHDAPPRAAADVGFTGDGRYTFSVLTVDDNAELPYYLLARGDGALEGDDWAMGANLHIVQLTDCGQRVVDPERVVDALKNVGR